MARPEHSSGGFYPHVVGFSCDFSANSILLNWNPHTEYTLHKGEIGDNDSVDRPMQFPT